jgi:hypothetical protein
MDVIAPPRAYADHSLFLPNWSVQRRSSRTDFHKIYPLRIDLALVTAAQLATFLAADAVDGLYRCDAK